MYDFKKEEIEQLLMESSYTPTQLSRILEVKVSVIIDDLKHISKSRKGEIFVIPAKCKKCGFEFKPEIKIPKRCPKCKSEWIEEPLFKIISKDS